MESLSGQRVDIVNPPVQVDDVKESAPTGLRDSTNVDGGGKKTVIRNETAAVEVQRMYRGHRTRRTIADAATMAHKFGWWNVVEGAMLQHHSSQFYAYNTPQNAAQRWLRLKKKAAKVGKGLSKNEQARKLALQHWLEAIDPRHRYGHNLNFYYQEWDKCQTQEPFFYWLDVGEGKDVNLVDKCKRSKLQKEVIRYLSPGVVFAKQTSQVYDEMWTKERKRFEVVVQDGKLFKYMTGEPVDTPKGEKWIFVMSTNGRLYVGKKEKGKLQHSSFLAGGATTAAGRLLVKNGTIELMEAHSGHYHPTPDNFHQLIKILTGSGADLTVAKVQFVSDDMLSDSIILPEPTVEIVQQDVPVDALKEVDNKGDGCIRHVESLTLTDEQNACSVDHVTLMEDTVSQEAPANGDVEVEGHELLGVKSRFDDKDLLENLEGMKLDLIKPAENVKSSQDKAAIEREVNSSVQDASNTSPLKLSRTISASQHKLFGPAMRTFSNLEGRSGNCLSDVHDPKADSTAELTPKVKLLLLRRLSMNNTPGVVSS